MLTAQPSEPVLLGGISVLLLLIGWTGWRFFYASPVGLSGRRGSWPTLRRRFIAATVSARPRRASGLPRRRRIVLLALPAGTASLSMAAAFLVARGRRLEPARAEPLADGHPVRALLGLAPLMPPPPLPPAAFRETERPDLESADRNWDHLDPRFAALLLHLLARMERRGFTLVLLEGYRSPERQDWLAAMGPHVTRLRGLQGMHCQGLAADLAPLRGGRPVISEADPWAWQAYRALGQEAASLGLTWGGNWRMRDFGHVECAHPRMGRPIPGVRPIHEEDPCPASP